MAATTLENRRGDDSLIHSVRWKRALQVGLVIGGVMFLLSRGIPWVGSGAINPAIMGREVAPGEDTDALFSFSVIGLHLIVSVLYALIIAPIVHGFRPWIAGLVGGIIGLVLYFINFALSAMIMETALTQREWPAVILHIAFGVVVAEAYKGFVRPETDRVEP